MLLAAKTKFPVKQQRQLPDNSVTNQPKQNSPTFPDFHKMEILRGSKNLGFLEKSLGFKVFKGFKKAFVDLKITTQEEHPIHHSP